MIKSNKNNKKKKGFTLVELVAVIAIIGILAAVLVPKITGYIAESRKVAVIDQARKVVSAAESITIKKALNDTAYNGKSITDTAADSGGLLVIEDITKIDHDVTVAVCKQILDTENETFTVDNTGRFEGIE